MLIYFVLPDYPDGTDFPDRIGGFDRLYNKK